MSEVAQAVAAIGTLIIAVLAIWGDWFRARFAGPKLRTYLRSERGHLTTRANGVKTVYYHLIVVNDRRWSPARNVTVKLTGIESKAADGSYRQETLIHKLQLRWGHAEFHEISPTIGDDDQCDIGFLDEGSDKFIPVLYVMPNNFAGFVKKGESKRYTIEIAADNFHAEKPLVIVVSWDGTWTDDTERLMHHLVVKQIEIEESS